MNLLVIALGFGIVGLGALLDDGRRSRWHLLGAAGMIVAWFGAAVPL